MHIFLGQQEIRGLCNGVAIFLPQVANPGDTVIILDNRTTAMTGHQPNPGVDMKELGFDGYNTISIESLVTSLGVQHVSTIKPFNLKKSTALIKDALNFKGVSVVIAKEKCILYAKSLKQARGKAFRVTDKCKNHKNCINELACPAFYIDDGRVKINESLCTGCSVCAQVCPEHAIAPVKG